MGNQAPTNKPRREVRGASAKPAAGKRRVAESPARKVSKREQMVDKATKRYAAQSEHNFYNSGSLRSDQDIRTQQGSESCSSVPDKRMQVAEPKLEDLGLPRDLGSMHLEDQIAIMEKVYVQQFKSSNGKCYYLDVQWIQRWLSYMKRMTKAPPGPIDNSEIERKLRRLQEVRIGQDAYFVNQRLWYMFVTVYGGGPKLFEGKETGEASPYRNRKQYQNSSYRGSTTTADPSESRSQPTQSKLQSKYSRKSSIESSSQKQISKQTPRKDSSGSKPAARSLDQTISKQYKRHQFEYIPKYPAKFKLTDGVVGFYNNYLYCYLNACLQMLMSITPLRDFLVNQVYLDCQSISRMSGRAGSPQQMCFAMAKTYYSVWSHKSSYSDPVLRTTEIQQQLRGTFSPMNENDCHQALLFILSRLQEELTPRNKKYSLQNKSPAEAWKIYRSFNPSVIDSLFCGLLRSTVTCGGCGYESVIYDPFYDLPLPIKGIRGDISACLEKFLLEQKFEKKMYDCEKCKKRNKATKKFDLVRVPRYLLVVLKRFSGISSKIRSTINFPMELDLSKMLTKDHISEHKRYKLISMMEHLGGSARSGHYIGFFERNGQEADDERIRSISSRALQKEEAYVLLYQAF